MQSSGFSRLVVAFTIVLSASVPGLAHEFRLGAIRVDHPAAPASLPGQTSAVVYLTIENQGATTDRLVALDSPAAQSVVVHRMSMNGPVMAMREMNDLPLEPLAKVALTAGSNYHVMMTGLKQPLVVKDKIPLMLTFERAGKMEVMVNVERSAAGKPADGGGEKGADKGADKAIAPHQH